MHPQIPVNPISYFPLSSAEQRYSAALASYSRRAFAEALATLAPLLGTLAATPPAVRLAALNLAAACSLETGRLQDAHVLWCRAIELKPDFAEALSNLGWLLRQLGRLPEAETACRKALAVQPGYASAHNNLANVLVDMKRFEEAETAYREALKQRPDYVDAQYNLALLLLGMGRFTEGWQLHEARHDARLTRRAAFAPPLACPQWRGESLEGKSLLVWYEQGLGDMIQFGRYLRLLKARGTSKLVVACAPALERLFGHADGGDVVGGPDVTPEMAACDYWTFLMSVPLHLGTTPESVPAATWLAADPALMQAWRERLAPLNGPKVGLVWKGSAAHRNNANRSLASLSILAPLWRAQGISFVSLQKGEGGDEAYASPAGQPMLHLGSMMSDFADTAAVVAQLDLVIGVDTSVVHLAGSLGKPCWVLLPYAATDWRWMHGRTDALWYPGSMRLFRQPAPGDWASVMEEVGDALVETFPDAGFTPLPG